MKPKVAIRTNNGTWIKCDEVALIGISFTNLGSSINSHYVIICLKGSDDDITVSTPYITEEEAQGYADYLAEEVGFIDRSEETTYER